MPSKLTTLPSIFLSHGSPMVSLDHHNPIKNLWRSLMIQIQQSFMVEAILIISAHYTTKKDIEITCRDSSYPLIYDYFGFPNELYQLKYSCAGSSKVAHSIQKELKSHNENWSVHLNSNRGLDHGSFIPLLEMNNPSKGSNDTCSAPLPVVSMSVPLDMPIKELLQLGRALHSLKSQGILIVGSGGENHSFEEFFANDGQDFFHQILSITKKSRKFGDDLRKLVIGKGLAYNPIEKTLSSYREEIDGAKELHPTDEHFRPFFMILGSSIGDDNLLNGQYIWHKGEPTGIFLFHESDQDDLHIECK